MKASTGEIVESWVCGNKEDFRKWVKKAKKLDLLDAIEFFSANHGPRHQIISGMYDVLKG